MIKHLNTEEYNEALTQGYGVSHFMGGFSGTRNDATIYLYGINGISLVSNDEEFELARINNLQTKEAKDWMQNNE